MNGPSVRNNNSAVHIETPGACIEGLSMRN
jgi:hypothetical protein